MKNIITYLILAIILSSCSVEFYIRKAKEKCPECFTEKRDTVINIIKKDTIIKIDTTFLINFLDSIDINEPIKRHDSIIYIKNFNSDTIIKSKQGIEVKIWIRNSRINANIKVDSTIYYRYQDSLRIKDAKIYELTQVIINKDIDIKKERTFKYWLKIGFISALSIICLGLLFFIIKIINKIK